MPLTSLEQQLIVLWCDHTELSKKNDSTLTEPLILYRQQIPKYVHHKAEWQIWDFLTTPNPSHSIQSYQLLSIASHFTLC